jgi:hypothetical protein
MGKADGLQGEDVAWHECDCNPIAKYQLLDLALCLCCFLCHVFGTAQNWSAT